MKFTFDEATCAAQDIVTDICERHLSWNVVTSAEHEVEGVVRAGADAVLAAGLVEAFLGGDEDVLGPEALAAVLCAEGARGSMLGLLTRIGYGLAVLTRVDGDLAARLAGSVAAGETLVTAAVTESGAAVLDCGARAVRTGADYRITGTKTSVPDLERASAVMVPARLDDDSVGVFLIDTGATGSTAAPQPTGCHLSASWLRAEAVEVAADRLLRIDGSHEAVAVLLDRVVRLSLLATGAGLVRSAMELTREHVRTRRQFDRALAEFQSVSMRMGDMYLADLAVDSTVRAASWAMQAEDAETVDHYLSAAAVTFCREGIAAVMIGQQLHGGTGLDLDHPYHRILTTALHISNMLGGLDGAFAAVPAGGASERGR